MKTDSIFYRLFKELPSSFFELIGQEGDRADNYSFDSIEVKQTSFRIDGVFVPTDPTSPIYFTEVQFQKDIEIYARLFSEIFVYLRNSDVTTPWRAVIIFKSRGVEPKPEEYDPYLPLLESDRVTRIYLNEIEVPDSAPLTVKAIQLIVLAKRKVRDRVRQLVSQTKREIPDDKSQARVLDLIQTILAYKLPNLSKKELEAMFGVEDLKKARFVREMREEMKEEVKQEVKEEVKQETELETKLKTVPRMLQRGFSVEDIADILDLDIDRVREAARSSDS